MPASKHPVSESESEYSEYDSDESPDARSCSQSDYDDDAYPAELLDVLHDMKRSLKSISLLLAEFLKNQGTDHEVIKHIIDVDADTREHVARGGGEGQLKR